MLESKIESTLGKRLKALDCLYLKFVSPSNRGVPDRIVIRPDGVVEFVELKTEIGRLSALQERMLYSLMMYRQHVYVVKGWDGMLRYVERLEKDLRDNGNEVCTSPISEVCDRQSNK